MNENNNVREVNSDFNDTIDYLKDAIQDSNINFLVGSGASTPFFGTLGQIEVWLEELEQKLTIDELETNVYNIVRASLYKAYFNVAMKDNKDILNIQDPTSISPVSLSKAYNNYREFLKYLNILLYERRSNTVNKHVNLFTTNIDVFFEKVLEDLGYNFNDGFTGVFKRKFGLSNFKRTIYQKSLQYDNVSELPAFNVLKVHGSVTWEMEKNNIFFSELDRVKYVEEILSNINLIDVKSLDNECWKKNNRSLTTNEIIEGVTKNDLKVDVSEFLKVYEQLQIVNPTKEKFKHTTFNKNYYELLRLYSNELEKENTILFILGFSMADEHLREITLRVIKSNPTLMVLIVSYKRGAPDIIENFKNDGESIDQYSNVKIISPEDEFSFDKFNESVLKAIVKDVATEENIEDYEG